MEQGEAVLKSGWVMQEVAKCPNCGAELLRDMIRKGRKVRIYKNYRCPKCDKT